MTAHEAIRSAEELIEYLEKGMREECLGRHCDSDCSVVGDLKCTARSNLRRLVQALKNEV